VNKVGQEFKTSTESYLEWIGGYCKLDQKGLEKKQKKMRENAFAFLRGTFYRWPVGFREIDDPIRNAPTILCVGDCHLENFGTWRDPEGRLIWGINDFDEAARLPFTSDLVRLATSARLAAEQLNVSLSADHAVDAILEGYENHVRFGPLPFVLEDRHPWLRDLAVASGADALEEWQTLTEKEIPASDVDRGARALLESALPTGSSNPRFGRRRSGLGSLGRPKYIAVAELSGGLVAREAKAAAPSAVHHAAKIDDPLAEYREIERTACRVRDPFLRLEDGWVIRRLSPEARKIELVDLAGISDLRHFLHATGRELANVHIGVLGSQEPLTTVLKALPAPWLRNASDLMSTFVRAEYKAFAED
jgi:uncharacterized protein (DUF2252 family)